MLTVTYSPSNAPDRKAITNKHFLLKRLTKEAKWKRNNFLNWFKKYSVTKEKWIPDLQLSSTTCWIRPPRKGTRTISKCSKFRADAKPVTKGTYFKEFVGPKGVKNTSMEQCKLT